MKNILFIGLLLAGCGQITTTEDELIDPTLDSAPMALFEQTYPDTFKNLNYYDLVPNQIRDNLPFGFVFAFRPKSVTSQKIKTITSEFYDGPDTSISKYEFDKFGNLLYQKLSTHEGVHIRYQFGNDGQILNRFKFLETGGLSQTERYHYNQKNQIDLVEANLGGHVDSIMFEYDSIGNLIKAGEKILIYDNNGNCIEWFIEPSLSCGNSEGHWKGEYNDQGELIDSWGANSLWRIYALSGHKYDVQYDTIFSESGKITSISTYSNQDLSSVDRYEYFPNLTPTK